LAECGEGHVDRIIDFHSHLGDLLYPNGGELIGRTRVVKPAILFDAISMAESRLHSDFLGLGGRTLYSLMGRWITRASRARNATATYENFRRSMDETGITHSVCLPIPPNVSFADLETVSATDGGIIPFTGVDFTRDEDPGPALEADVAAGARGLKLHPILQRLPLTSPRTMAAVEAFRSHGLPVLFHCGISFYYFGEERAKQEPRYGEIRYAVELVGAFPGVRFVAGHSGLMEVREVIERLAGHRNVWVETSFQSVASVRELIARFGPDRVLFGSDWPFGNRRPALAIAKAVCRGDEGLERQIFFENAAELLGLR
jgi:predicted TIM-barrel fold metal-dependent hydrolase